MNSSVKKSSSKIWVALVSLAVFNLAVAPATRIAAQQDSIIAAINFDPKADFNFAKYGNANRAWQKGLRAEDMIWLFSSKIETNFDKWGK